MPFRLTLEPPPQQLGDDEAENAIAEEFEALIATGRGAAAGPTPPVLLRHRARMGQRLLAEFRPAEGVPDFIR
jgi:hypothetical protein